MTSLVGGRGVFSDPRSAAARSVRPPFFLSLWVGGELLPFLHDRTMETHTQQNLLSLGGKETRGGKEYIEMLSIREKKREREMKAIQYRLRGGVRMEGT